MPADIDMFQARRDDATPETVDLAETKEAGRWNHRPPTPIAQNPLFLWPPNPKAIFKWYAAFWFEISTTTLCFVLALGAYFLILPDLVQMQTFSPGWMIRVWLANLVPQCLIAGTLHHWLITRKGQGDTSKFDPRDQNRKNGSFTFGNQVLDNMFWHIASGITLWSLAQIGVFWMMANGYAPTLLFPDNTVWFVAVFVLIPIWSSFHFYWVHRLLHWPPLYKMAHSLHHRNINVGPWSGISMHPIEHALFYTNFLIHLVVPTHPLHVMFHGYVQSTHPVFSHSGFEQLVVKESPHLRMGVFFHQLHHRYFECNYGTVEMPWDRWFGSYHDGTGKATDEARARKTQMYT